MDNIRDARVLLNLGDSVTTDHISPAGSIARNSAAAKYLTSKQYVCLSVITYLDLPFLLRASAFASWFFYIVSFLFR